MANGHVESVNANELTPFVTLKFFVEDSMIRLHRKLTLAQLCDTINLVFGNVNRPFALRIDGEFASVRTRSFEPQQKPYKPMVDIMDSQKFTNFENVRGTLIGFRVPQYLADLNVPGFHFHFITDAKDMGGHVLDCTIENVRIGIDWADDLTVSFPHTGSFAGTDLNVNQRSALDRVER
jgi:acetolactate decarboxylase